MATFKVSTKQDKNAKAQETALEIIYDDAEVERTLATQQAVVRVQAHWRKHGIPAKATLKFSELKAGLRAETLTPDALVNMAKSDPVLRAKILAELGVK